MTGSLFNILADFLKDGKQKVVWNVQRSKQSNNSAEDSAKSHPWSTTLLNLYQFIFGVTNSEWKREIKFLSYQYYKK